MPTTTVPSVLAPGFSGRNLLLNAGFNVNQRVYSSGAATSSPNQYTVDRWRVVTSGQSLVVSGGTATAPAGGVEQVIEGANIPVTGTYVLNWVGTATATVNGGAVAKGGTVALTAGVNATVRFTGGTVGQPQLEFGTAPSTFEVRPFAEELALCMRYYEKSFDYGIAPVQNVGNYNGALVGNCLAASTQVQLPTVWYKVQKRTNVTPTLFNPGAANAQIRNMAGGTDFTGTATTSGDKGFTAYGTSPGGSTIGNLCAVHWVVDAEI